MTDAPPDAEIQAALDELAARPAPPPLPEIGSNGDTEVLFRCLECGADNTPGMWEFAGRRCPDCGADKGAVQA